MNGSNLTAAEQSQRVPAQAESNRGSAEMVPKAAPRGGRRRVKQSGGYVPDMDPDDDDEDDDGIPDSEDTEDNRIQCERLCDSLLVCIVTALNEEPSNGGGIGDILRKPSIKAL